MVNNEILHKLEDIIWLSTFMEEEFPESSIDDRLELIKRFSDGLPMDTILFLAFLNLPPERVQPIKDEYIYLIISKNQTKIGVSFNPEKRTKVLGTKLPFEIEKIIWFKCHGMYKVESFLHNKYKNKRLNGEWFNLSKEDINDIYCYMASIA